MKPFSTGFIVVLVFFALADASHAQSTFPQFIKAAEMPALLFPRVSQTDEAMLPKTPGPVLPQVGEFNDASGKHRVIEQNPVQTRTPDGYRVTEYDYEVWDTVSSTWKYSRKYLLEYDSTGKTSQFVTEVWSDSLGWVYSSRDVYTYGANGKETETLNELWTGGTWHDTTRYYYEYNPSGQEIEYGYESWNGSAWVDSYRFQYIYTSYGNLGHSLRQNWADTGWVNSTNRTWYFNLNQTINSAISQSWMSNAWVNTQRDSQAYDVKDSIILHVYQSWADTAWKNSSKYMYTYKGNGLLSQSLYQFYITDWQNLLLYSYSYDGSGNKLQDLLQSWGGTAWFNSSNTQYTYDINMRITSAVSQLYNSGWVNSSKFMYIYDGNGNRIEFDYQIWKNNNWLNSSRDVYTFETVLGVEENNPLVGRRFNLEQNYPNPFNPSTVIRFDVPHQGVVSLKVYDVLGQEISTLVNETKMPGEYSVRWDASKFPSGIYFYRLAAGNFSETKKLVLMK